MIDTIELKIMVKADDIQALAKAIDVVIKNNRVKYYAGDRIKYSQVLHKVKEKQGFGLHTNGLFQYGWQDLKIELLGNNYNGNKYYHYNLAVVYKPSLVLHPDDYYGLSYFSEYDAAKVNFDNVVRLINNRLSLDLVAFRLPEFEYWRVSRIDYAMQISTNHYLAFWYLFKNYWLKYPPSIYIYKEASTINFYDKTYKKIHSTSSLQEHIFRFEVQCHGKWIDNSYSKGRIASKGIRSLWDKKLADAVIISKFYEIFGMGDFYTLEEAIVIIKKHYSSKKANFMIEFLMLTKIITVDEAVKYLAKKHNTSNQKIRRNYLRELNKIGVGYICLPSSYDWAKACALEIGIEISDAVVNYYNNNVITCIWNPLKELL